MNPGDILTTFQWILRKNNFLSNSIVARFLCGSYTRKTNRYDAEITTTISTQKGNVSRKLWEITAVG